MSRINPNEFHIVKTSTQGTKAEQMLSSKQKIRGLGLIALTGVISFTAIKGIAQSNSTASFQPIAAVSNTFQQPEERYAIAFRLVDTGSQINVRSGPGTNYSLKHYGLGGDAVTGLNQRPGNDGYEWFFVQFDQSGAKGWIREDLLIQDKTYESSLGGFTPESEADSNAKPLPEQYVILQSGNPNSKINVRRGPGTNYGIRHYGLSGDQVSILDSAEGSDGSIWYELSFIESGAEGWVREDLLAFIED